MERLDARERLSSPMEKYLSQNGWHISKALCGWACSRMKDRNGARHQTVDKQKTDEYLRVAGVQLKNDLLHDSCFVFNMAQSDYLGGCLKDMNGISYFVRDYLDDPDGSETRAMDELVGRCIGAGIPIPWEDVL